MTRTTLRRLIVVFVAALVVGLSYSGLREFRKRQWQGIGPAWVKQCAAGLASEAEHNAADRFCSCELDYIQVRWTPNQYGRASHRINQMLVDNGIVDRCMNWAGGWSKERP